MGHEQGTKKQPPVSGVVPDPLTCLTTGRRKTHIHHIKGEQIMNQEKTKVNPYINAAIRLADRHPDLHIVLCDQKKKPYGKGWQAQGNGATTDGITTWLTITCIPGMIGIIPASAGMIVIDVDAGDPTAVIRAIGAEPVLDLRTRREGGHHLYYRCDDSANVRNGSWQIDGAHGDIRGGKGYVVLHSANAIDALCAAMEGDHGHASITRAEINRLVKPHPQPEPAPRGAGRPQSGLTRVREARVGERNNVLNAAVYADASAGKWSDALGYQYAAAAAEIGLEREEIEQTINSASRAGTEEWRRKVEETESKMNNALSGTDAEIFTAALETIGIELRYNTLRDLREYRSSGISRVPSAEWDQYSDGVGDLIRETIKEQCNVVRKGKPAPLDYRDTMWNRTLSAHIQLRQHDPYDDWVRSLPAPSAAAGIGMVDGAPVLDMWLCRAIGGEDTPLTRWVAKYILCTVALRHRQPAAKADIMPILWGAQGIGKSSVLGALLPPHLADRLFSGGLEWGLSSQQTQESIGRARIVEVAETIWRGDIERVKAWLTLRIDRIRKPYAREVSEIPRICAVIGTSNSSQCMPDDPTGNRRFITVHCNPPAGKTIKSRLAWLGEYRTQMWAQAYAAVDAGWKPIIPPELAQAKAEQEEEQSQRNDVVEDLVRDYIDRIAPDRDVLYLPDLVRSLCWDSDGRGGNKKIRDEWRMQREASRTLTSMGYEPMRVRVDGPKKRLWCNAKARQRMI